MLSHNSDQTIMTQTGPTDTRSDIRLSTMPKNVAMPSLPVPAPESSGDTRNRQIVRRLAPRRLARAVRSRVRSRATQWAYSKALKNPRYGALYYFLEGSFDREFGSVLHGRLAHSALSTTTTARNDAAAFTLRRNVHRVEKGLIMRPRREVFASDYIGETTNAYQETVTAGGDPDLLAWATDVLDEYFSVVTAEPAVVRARKIYDHVRPDTRTEGDTRRVPYLRDTDPLDIKIDDMEALAKRRRSVRWFDGQSVPRDCIDRALTVAMQSPSACNRQPFYFYVFDDSDLVQRISRVPMGTRGYAHNIPAIAVIVGRQRAYFSERDRHLIYIDGSLAAMSFMYALEVQGIASCPINWPDMDEREREMADLLALEPDERPVMLIAFGYPDPEGAVPYSQKKPLTEALSYNYAPGATQTASTV